MKVIGIRGNYGDDDSSGVYLMADSSLLKDNKPFFVPDFAERFTFAPTIVVHVCRLGKNIAKKFAQRYYDKLTVGFAVEAEGLDGSLKNAFDGAAILGDFIDLAALPAEAIGYEVKVDGSTCFTGSTAMLNTDVDGIIEYVSRYMTLKIGDYIFVSRPQCEGVMTINTHITATLDGKEVINMKVK